MSGKWNGKKLFHIFVLALAGIALMDFLFFHEEGGEGGKDEERFSWRQILAEGLGREVTAVWLPAFSFAGQGSMEQKGGFLEDILERQSPFLAYGLEGGEETDGLQTESGSLMEKFLRQEGLSEDEESETGDALEMPKTEEGKLWLDEEAQRRLREENQAEQNGDGENAENGTLQGGVSENGTEPARKEDAFGFVKAQARSQEYD